MLILVILPIRLSSIARSASEERRRSQIILAQIFQVHSVFFTRRDFGLSFLDGESSGYPYILRISDDHPIFSLLRTACTSSSIHFFFLFFGLPSFQNLKGRFLATPGPPTPWWPCNFARFNLTCTSAAREVYGLSKFRQEVGPEVVRALICKTNLFRFTDIDSGWAITLDLGEVFRIPAYYKVSSFFGSHVVLVAQSRFLTSDLL